MVGCQGNATDKATQQQIRSNKGIIDELHSQVLSEGRDPKYIYNNSERLSTHLRAEILRDQS